MTARHRTFSVDIQKFAQKAKQREIEFVRAFCLLLAERIIERTPVDTGFARANWFASLQGFDGRVLVQVDGQAYPNGSLAEIALVSAGIQPNMTFYIYNNAPYILPLEHGHSKQAPQGMVKLTVAEAEALARQAYQNVVGAAP